VKKIFLLAFLFFNCFVYSQNNSNLKALDTISSNQDKLDFIGKIIVSQIYSNPENIEAYAHKFDSISKIEVTLENTADAYNYKGISHYVNQEYEQAITYYLEAARTLEKGDVKNKLCRVYNNIASCYNIRKDFENTEKYFVSSLNLAKEINDLPMIANLNNNLSVLYMNNKMYKKADNMIENALEYYQSTNDSLMMGISYMNYGNSKVFSEDYPNAILNYNKLKNFVSYDTFPLLYAVSNTGIGTALTRQKKYLKALPFLLEGLKIGKEIKHTEQVMESYSALSNYYSETKDYKNAYLLSIESQKLKDSVLSSTQDKNMADALTKYQSEKKDTELKLLKVEGEKSEQQKRMYFILFIAGLLILGLLCFFGYKNKKKNVKLAKQKKLLESTLDEKNTLLKEIHHRVKNSFQIVSSLLYLQSENVEDKEAKIAIKEAENRVRSMVLIHQRLYNKDEMVGINTENYFNDLVKDIIESHQFKKEPISYTFDVEPLVLDIETITPIGLILNELIVNTLKHAFETVDSNSNILVKFEKQDDQLILKVIDNGKGFEGEIKSTSFGITLMKALSKKLKATLNYVSEPTTGTEAILNIKKFTILD
jgi:two-component sensor histidine kinase